MEVKNKIAMGIASQMEWLANKVGNHNSVKSFAVHWDGEAEHLQGTIVMDAPAWIRSVLAEQEGVKAMQQEAYNAGVHHGVAHAQAEKDPEPSRGN